MTAGIEVPSGREVLRRRNSFSSGGQQEQEPLSDAPPMAMPTETPLKPQPEPEPPQSEQPKQPKEPELPQPKQQKPQQQAQAQQSQQQQTQQQQSEQSQQPQQPLRQEEREQEQEPQLPPQLQPQQPEQQQQQSQQSQSQLQLQPLPEQPHHSQQHHSQQPPQLQPQQPQPQQLQQLLPPSPSPSQQSHMQTQPELQVHPLPQNLQMQPQPSQLQQPDRRQSPPPSQQMHMQTQLQQPEPQSQHLQQSQRQQSPPSSPSPSPSHQLHMQTQPQQPELQTQPLPQNLQMQQPQQLQQPQRRQSPPQQMHMQTQPQVQAQQLQHIPQNPQLQPQPQLYMGGAMMGRRKIQLRLQEDVRAPATSRKSFLGFRRPGAHAVSASMSSFDDLETQFVRGIDRGRMTVSWYDGTTTLELLEHVRSSVTRKVGLGGTSKLDHIRILDSSTQPPEEIVLSPYIPDGSTFLLRFTTKDAGGEQTPVGPYGFPHRNSYGDSAPESPSAAPSPYPSSANLRGLGLNANQLALLGARLKGLQMPNPYESDKQRKSILKPLIKENSIEGLDQHGKPIVAQNRVTKDSNGSKPPTSPVEDDTQSRASSTFEMPPAQPEAQVESRLTQILELLVAERGIKRASPERRQEKRQVVFVLANYFVLFISLIAISAEIQARAPKWHSYMEKQLQNVQSCATDQESLIECLSNGDFAGLIASVVLWMSRSAATKRIFLFGFESPKKLWTVVYESLVTAVCWGFSYMFIRRGMNPDTNRNFLHKYWKDAVYGSLAGFNAAFMKHVLKNLIPQEAIEDALQDRQLRILSWLPSFTH